MRQPHILTKTEIKEAIHEDTDSLEILEEDNLHIAYWEEDRGYFYKYFQETETAETLSNRIHIEKQIEPCLSVEKLSKLLYQTVDKNALCCCGGLYLLYDDENDESPLRNQLEQNTNDEYAQEIGIGQLGITWVEQSIIIINIKELIKTSQEIAQEPDEYHTYQEIFVQGIASTIYHEFRHLLYECNEIIELGNDYPEMDGTEDKVEDYGNTCMEETLPQWISMISHNNIPKCCNQKQPDASNSTYNEFNIHCRQQNLHEVFTTKSQAVYFRIRTLFAAHNIKFLGYGDDYNGEYEIRFSIH